MESIMLMVEYRFGNINYRKPDAVNDSLSILKCVNNIFFSVYKNLDGAGRFLI